MNISEYMEVCNLCYLEYCDYLQDKYGIGKYDYMTKSWNKNPKSSRTNEGLIAHHKYEDRVILLSKKEMAMNFPFEWQKKENLIYCDYLEHLLLHILICEHPSEEKVDFLVAGVGGIVNFISPELNDLYSGWVTTEPWRLNCHNLVKNDKDVYLTMLKRFKGHPLYKEGVLYKSYNEKYHLWSSNQNKKIYDEIRSL